MIPTEKVAGAGADMAADQDVPLQADHHQPGHDFKDQDDDADNDGEEADADDDYADNDDDVKDNQTYSAAGARPGESFEGRRRIVRADETQPRAAAAQMGQLSAREGLRFHMLMLNCLNHFNYLKTQMGQLCPSSQPPQTSIFI